MGRAILQYVPRAVTALMLTECLLSFIVVYALQDVPNGAGPVSGSLNNALAACLGFAIGGVTLIASGQTGDNFLARRHLLYTALVAGIVALPLMAAVETIFGGPFPDLWSMLLLWSVWLAAIVSFRTAVSLMADRARPSRRVLIIGDPKRIEAVGARLLRARNGMFEPLTGDPLRLSSELLRQQGISAVVVSGATPPSAMPALLDCKLRGIPVFNELLFQERHLGRVDLDTLTAGDIVFADGFTDGWISRALKRSCDIAIALTLLFVTLPLMALTAIAIKADSAGPVLYRQQRVGYLGRIFTLYKFRSMTTDAEAGGPIWAQHADPRVTRVGSFIRATRIDELPQLANVIMGEMSLVGPRPERPHFVRQLADAIPFYHERSYVKPGLTGWAQVNYPYGASVEDAREKLAYDLFYVKHRGMLLDLFILMATVRVVLFREGAR
ncbi:MAG: exopolysaccharide biosynthesis polyprenyl glycosylphosphotransferase [Acetobacteraceae bacterium]|nr:exopolysaccharide biosynthesis polyprenyl glycosylphosphotransferase [Pseudomonadota bacterium]